MGNHRRPVFLIMYATQIYFNPEIIIKIGQLRFFQSRRISYFSRRFRWKKEKFYQKTRNFTETTENAGH